MGIDLRMGIQGVKTMKFIKTISLFSLALSLLLIAGATSYTSAQGRGGGKPAHAGPPTGAGNNGGQGNPSTNSNGHADDGLGTASSNSNGRSDAGLARARRGSGNANMPSDNELNRYNGISRKLGVSPETLRAQYAAALLANPDLKFGQFVAANVIADNLNGRNSSITSSSILLGLQNGDSIGKTLKNLGLSGDEAKRIEKAAKKQIKESKK